MLDPKLLRGDDMELAHLANILEKRGFKLDVIRLTSLEERRKVLQTETQELQHQRNAVSKQVGQAKGRGEDVAALLQSVADLGGKLSAKEEALSQLQQELYNLQSVIPNLPQDDVPVGKSEAENVELRRVGEIPTFNFIPKDHVALGEQWDLMDFQAAVKLTGTRFVVLHQQLAKLHRALGQFMLNYHTEMHGYQEVYVPYMVNKDSLFGTGQLPKFLDDQFRIAGDSDYFLIPTAEVPVTNLLRDVIVPAEQLPKKYVCHTPCFRSEAGSYGKDTRGMIRQHQFEKVELVQCVRPEDSLRVHEELTGHAEAILQQLKLPYRVMVLCTGDMGFTSSKTYDLEVWLPGQNTYREISSCSNFKDFQARRMQARWRNPNTGKTEYLHTLNGSGLPLGRTLVAIMENYQDEQGRIHIPEVLQPYMGGLKVIGAS